VGFEVERSNKISAPSQGLAVISSFQDYRLELVVSFVS
jgi:hypothetical protein